MKIESTKLTGSARRGPRGSRALYILACLLVSIGFATTLVACGGGSGTAGDGANSGLPNSTPGGDPQSGGTLNVETPLPIETLDQFKLPPTANTALTFVVESLVEPKPGTTKLEPRLAESWEIEDNARKYTFHLRPGVKFSNGDPMTSEDVVYTLELWKAFMLEVWPACCQHMTDIEAPSKDTVIVKFSQPQPSLLQYLAWSNESGIINSKVREEVGAAAFGRKPIGTGPFMVASFKSGDVRLVRNPTYWQEGQPYLDGVTVKTVPDPNTRILSVKSGETQIATGVPYSQARALENDPSGRLLVEDPWAAVYTVFINSSEAPLSELPVRRALSYATDRKTILANALSGLGSVANSVAPPFGAYDPSVQQLPYDLDLAKQELAKSATPDGFPLEILVQSGDTSGEVTATVLQNSFRTIGISSSIRKVDPGTYINDFIAGKYEIAVGPYDWWMASSPEPDSQIVGLYDTPEAHNTFTWHEDPKGTELSRQLVVATDPAERKEIAGQLQERSIQDPPILAVAFLTNVTLVGTNVCDFHMRPVERILGPSEHVYLSSEC